MLFSEKSIGNLKLKNRFIRSATCDYLAEDNGGISERQESMYKSLASGGASMLITGFIAVSEKGVSVRGQNSFANKDDSVDSYKRLTSIVHNENSLITAQLVHGGGQSRVRSSAPLIVADKALAGENRLETKEASEDDIKQIIDDFVSGACFAEKVGFDAIQIHAAHGYLLSRFLSAATNKRKDGWGGSLENRVRIVLKIIEGIKEKCSLPILIKINGTDGGLKDGIDINESIIISKCLAKSGISAIEVSRGMPESEKQTVAVNENEPYIKKESIAIAKEVDIPIISVGGYRSLSSMEEAVKEGVSFISMSRPFIRESNAVTLLENGKEKLDCISCNKCFNPRGIVCAFV